MIAALPSNLNLAQRALYSIPDAAGVELSCREGTVWVTLDNDTRDYVLEAGQSFSTPEHRRALVYAIEPSRVGLEARASDRPAARAPTLRFWRQAQPGFGGP